MYPKEDLASDQLRTWKEMYEVEDAKVQILVSHHAYNVLIMFLQHGNYYRKVRRLDVMFVPG